MSEELRWRSPALDRDMPMKIYGDRGKPILVFPSAGGNHRDYEGFGMVEACRPFIDAGRIQLFAVDSFDNESWFNFSLPPCGRVARHERFERYILDEVLPYIRWRSGSTGIMTTGCSGGAYHAVNFLCRHPDAFDSCIALSGLYGHRFLFGDRWDDCLYFHFPLAYLPGLNDARQLELLRACKIVVCVGRGPWETCAEYDCIGDTEALKAVLDAKGIPAWVDFWGRDVNHDWPWWQRQMPYFLSKIL